jgi:hypothetical protein
MNREKMAEVMDYLFDHRAAGLPADGLAEVFERLVWCLEDNGAALDSIGEEWLRGDDPARVEVMLAVNEWFPFKDPLEMEAVFTRIAARWPELAPRCTERIEQRREQHARLERRGQ